MWEALALGDLVEQRQWPIAANGNQLVTVVLRGQATPAAADTDLPDRVLG
jgi:hypothetical protein